MPFAKYGLFFSLAIANLTTISIGTRTMPIGSSSTDHYAAADATMYSGGAGDSFQSALGDLSTSSSSLGAEQLIVAQLVEKPKRQQGQLKAIVGVHVKLNEVEKSFQEELRQLELKYAPKFQELYAKRCQLVSGELEATDADPCRCLPSLAQYEAASDQNGGDNVQLVDEKNTAGGAAARDGSERAWVPNFWLTVLKNR